MRLISPVSLQQTLTDTDTAATYSFRWRPRSDDRAVPRNQYVLQTYSMSRSLPLPLRCRTHRAESILGSIAEVARCLLFIQQHS